MNPIVKSFGINAGKLWKILNEEGPQVQTKLIKKAGMRPDEFFGAVGWLARENKICKDKRTYKIGETNLTDKIGTDAGSVWNALGINKEIDVTAIVHLSKIDKNDCYSALGWRALV